MPTFSWHDHPVGGGNALIRELSPKSRADVLRAAKLQTLRPRQILYSQDSAIRAVHFPVKGFISLMMGLEDGTMVETASVGREGVVGVALALGTERHAAAAVVRVAGAALAFSGPTLRELMEKHEDLRSAVLRWTAALIADTEVTLGCVAHHTIPQRLARWIVSAEHRVGTDNVLPITHEELAQCIGAQRPSVSQAAVELQRAHAIQYHRGHLRVVDHSMLERLACRCHQAMSWTGPALPSLEARAVPEVRRPARRASG